MARCDALMSVFRALLAAAMAMFLAGAIAAVIPIVGWIVASIFFTTGLIFLMLAFIFLRLALQCMAEVAASVEIERTDFTVETPVRPPGEGGGGVSG